MSRKFYFSFIFAAALLVIGHTQSFAQFAPVSGTVELLKADGTRVPVAGALIEVYRIDIKTGSPSAKTGKKGEFVFAGLQLGGVFAFGISAPNCAPMIFPNVKAGQEKLVLTLVPGNGNVPTEAEVRKGVLAKQSEGPAEPSEDEKKAKAEFDKKNADIMAKNERIKNADETARKSNEAGFNALKAEDFETAIAKFDEGIAAVPDFVGSTPVLLSGKMIAYKGKGFKTYKAGATSPDPETKKAKYAEANGYYDTGLAALQQALDIITKAPAAADPNEQKSRDAIKLDLYATATEIHRLKAVSLIDTSKAVEASAVINEYLALDTDPARKLTTQMTLGDIMRLTGDFEKAVASYRKVLEMKPDHPEALAGLGLSLFAQGAASAPEDKEKEQEGLNYMQKYTEIAPIQATDSQSVKELKSSVKEAVDYLKSQKMAPQKVPSSGKKKP